MKGYIWDFLIKKSIHPGGILAKIAYLRGILAKKFHENPSDKYLKGYLPPSKKPNREPVAASKISYKHFILVLKNSIISVIDRI